MKKVFLKKATCFLLILLMTMSSTIVICFARGHKRKFEYRALHPNKYTQKDKASEKYMHFMSKEEKRCLIKIYNKWREGFGSDKLCINDVFFVKEFKKLYIFLNSLEDLPRDERVEIFTFLDYCAEMNNIDI